MQIASRTDNLEVIRMFVVDIARNLGLKDDAINEIELAVDEACTNVIKHAYKNDNSQYIDITVKTNSKKITIIISDHGTGFNPDQLESPELRIKKHARGGLGIALIRKVMDEVSFDIHPGQHNEVKMVKYI
jgi:serine/threonine-protein kinase RsbW